MATAPTARGEGLAAVTAAELVPRGFLAGASNHTILCDLDGTDFMGVYKPREGERPLWDFPQGTLCQREVAAYQLSEALGWDLVPPTVLREGPFGIGSVQLFVPHDPREHYFNLVEDARHHAALAKMATFDLVANNADRKGSHILLADDRLCGIDHGLTFHPQPKLRTVIWDLGGRTIDRVWKVDLERVADCLADAANPLTHRFEALLSPVEVRIAARRAAVVAGLDRLPAVAEDERPYPWPPL